MRQPVDQGRGQGVVDIRQTAPFPEGSIRGEHDRSGFITDGNHLEQQIGPALVDGQITQLIEKEDVGTFIKIGSRRFSLKMASRTEQDENFLQRKIPRKK